MFVGRKVGEEDSGQIKSMRDPPSSWNVLEGGVCEGPVVGYESSYVCVFF